MARIAVDVGNSRISSAVVDGGKIVDIWHHDTLLPKEAADAILAGARAHRAKVAIASVVPEASDVLLSRLREGGEDVIQITTQSQPTISGTYKTLGIDRVASITAAIRLFGNGRGAFVIDCGTATTFTAASAAGEFQGGWITLGLGRTLRALNEHTDQLPDLTSKVRSVNQLTPGHRTDDAILQGTLLAHIGIIKQWIATAKAVLPGEHTTVITGGYATQIAPFLTDIEHLAPTLTLLGIDLIAQAEGALADRD
ncbi:MAG: type III pantothenate kinase [Candidatus Melainabacteria bacterium]|jgi:type III pantothenate kinase|nr:type III pantothenate kinase [Candidatus Melainabacteria bacterium]